MSLEQIIYSAKKGEEKAFKQLYNLYCRKWFTICLRYNKRRVDAEDVLQNALSKIFKNINQFNPKLGDFEGWAYRIVVNENLLFYKKKKDILLFEDVSNHGEEAVEILEYDTLNPKELVKLIQGLPEGYRTVFNLYVIEGYTHNEIAEILKISVGTSKSQLSKAKRELRTKIEVLLNVNH